MRLIAVKMFNCKSFLIIPMTTKIQQKRVNIRVKAVLELEDLEKKAIFTILNLHVGPLSSSGQIFPLKPRRISSSNIIGCQWPIIQNLEKN